jgi:hypothetical protein
LDGVTIVEGGRVGGEVERPTEGGVRVGDVIGVVEKVVGDYFVVALGEGGGREGGREGR